MKRGSLIKRGDVEQTEALFLIKQDLLKVRQSVNSIIQRVDKKMVLGLCLGSKSSGLGN